jgi:hypothetical protein
LAGKDIYQNTFLSHRAVKNNQKDSSVLDIAELSKDTVYNLMKDLLYSFNYGWFLLKEEIKRRYPEDYDSEEIGRLFEDYGSQAAERLSKILGTSDNGIDALIQLLMHSHWAVFEDIKVEKLTEKSFKMRVVDCTAQSAAKNWGMHYFNCWPSNFFVRRGFFQKINKNVRVERIFSPPQTRPEGIPKNVSCEWLISHE